MMRRILRSHKRIGCQIGLHPVSNILDQYQYLPGWSGSEDRQDFLWLVHKRINKGLIMYNFIPITLDMIDSPIKDKLPPLDSQTDLWKRCHVNESLNWPFKVASDKKKNCSINGYWPLLLPLKHSSACIEGWTYLRFT